MRKKGFTLIELLAVIIILAIIALIAFPIITDLITRSKYGAFTASKRNIEHAAELYYSTNAASVIWDNDVSYVTIGTLKAKKLLSNNTINNLNSSALSDDTKVLLYREGRKVSYSLQLYDEQFFDWYQKEMIKASKNYDVTLPNNIGEKVTVELDTLMNKELVDELRLPIDLESRCVGYVEIGKIAVDDYEYNAYVDCLTDASTFASHYVSYGGKYLDNLLDVKETSDGGFVAVGESNSQDYYGNVNKGNYDAIVVKFSSNGNIEWSHNFGGSSSEVFNSVVEVNDGYFIVGQTKSSDGDMDGLYRGGEGDALMVKYDKSGNLTYKKSYGSTDSWEIFNYVIASPTGYTIFGAVGANIKDGDLLGATMPGGNLTSIMLKLSPTFETISRTFFGGNYHDHFYSAITKNNLDGYVTVGDSAANDVDMAGMNKGPLNSTEGIIVSYNQASTLEYKQAFGGSKNDNFSSVVEVSDGYIAVGYSASSDFDMLGLSKASNGIRDAIIIKYDKTLTNILWKKSFGGSDEDVFTRIEKINDDEVVVVGYSKSNDMDMSDVIQTRGYKEAIIVRYNTANGNLISKKVFGGSNSDMFYSIIKTKDNNFVLAGNTFSIDNNLKNFNKGHSDAILVSYDNNFNLNKRFEEPVVLIDKLKVLVPNYGDSLSMKYENLYTSNDPDTELRGWCLSSPVYSDNVNYDYGICLSSFNSDDNKLLTRIDNVNSMMNIISGESEYLFVKDADNHYNWHRIVLYFSVSTASMEVSNLKLKFEDGYIGNISEAITNQYIEPLVTASNISATHYFPTPLNLLIGGSTGFADYSSLYINLKPKKSTLKGIIITSPKNVANSYDGLSVYELRNFDMSITPTS